MVSAGVVKADLDLLEGLHDRVRLQGSRQGTGQIGQVETSGSGVHRRPPDILTSTIDPRAELNGPCPTQPALRLRAGREPLVSAQVDFQGVLERHAGANGHVARRRRAASSSACSVPPAAASRRRCGIIAGLGEPSSGSIEWPGAALRRGRQAEREIGFVFQEPTLMPWATVARQCLAAAAAQGRVAIAPPAPRIRETLRMVGLDDIRRRLSARAVGRHEDARLHRPRAHHASPSCS